TFRGQGPIQLTGRSNYAAAAAALGNPTILTNPDQVGDSNNPLLGLRVAAWFWQSKGLNQTADTLQSDAPILVPSNYMVVLAITKAINGGTNGFLQRLNYTGHALSVLTDYASLMQGKAG